MLSKARKTSVAAGLTVALLCGCNTSSGPGASQFGKASLVTFHVKDMGKRLNLL